MRCCIVKYKVRQHEEKMPASHRDVWRSLPHFLPEEENEVVVSICHNCTNIYRKQHPRAKVITLWELLLQDNTLPLPDFHGEAMTVQDCWRASHNTAEQDAVRELMRRMNIHIVELPDNRDKTHFCGQSLYRAQPPRNPLICPEKYKTEAEQLGLFQPHTDEEIKQILNDYSRRYTTDRVVVYCHYCADGLKLAGKPHFHLAEMIFKTMAVQEKKPV